MSIVAAIDGSSGTDAIMDEANYLADGLNLELHVVHVKSVRDLESTPDTVGERKSIKEQTTAFVEEIAAEYTDEFRAVGLIGYPRKELVAYAEEHDARYIVMSGRKRTPTGKAMFGSTTQHVILNANCAVINVPRQT